MPNKIIENVDGSITLRIDDCYTSNAKHFFEAFVDKNGVSKYFGSFKFLNVQDAKKTLADAVKILQKKTGCEDTVFGGQYPKWVEEQQYGTQLRAQGRVKFYLNAQTKEEIPSISVEDKIFSLEIQLSVTKEKNDIFLRVARAVYQREGNRYNNDIFADDDLPF